MRIIVITEQGIVLAFDTKDIRTQSRGGKGVRAIRLEENDKVVSAVLEEEKTA